jgi:preprotein translocase subunit SecG
MLLNILLVILVIDCVALVCVVLMQRSEGGALGMGGGPQGMFTARGAGDLLTRATWILAWTFFGLSFAITLLTGFSKTSTSVVDRNNLDLLSSKQIPLPAGPPTQAPTPGAPANAPPPLPGSAPAPGASSAAPPLPQVAPAPTGGAAARPAPAIRTQPADPAPATPPAAN